MLVEINEMISCKTYSPTGYEESPPKESVKFAWKVFVTGIEFVLKFFVSDLNSIAISWKSCSSLFPISFQK